MFYLLRYEGGDSSANRYRAKVLRVKSCAAQLCNLRAKNCAFGCGFAACLGSAAHYCISAFRHFGILPCGLSPRVPCGFIHPLLLIVTSRCIGSGWWLRLHLWKYSL